MEKVFILGAKRTPLGSFLGSLKSFSASDLGSIAIKGAIEQSRIDVQDIDEVIMGNALPAGQGQGVARQSSLKASIPEGVPAYGVNMVCGSGLKSITNAFTSIRAEEAELLVAGGTESMSQAPFLLPERTREGFKLGDFNVKDSLVFDGLTDAFEGYHMGITAENIAEKYDISRKQQDKFAFDSQQKALRAIDSGFMKEEIIAVEIKERRSTRTMYTDEYPNRTTTIEKMSALRSAFKREGTVTAGNASGLNDGGSAIVVASGTYVQEQKLHPLAEIIAIGQGGVNPSVMGLGPVPAIKAALKKANLSFEDIDLFELNEAFASQSLGVLKELSDSFGVGPEYIQERTNINGGAIALGHPIGASGNRILVTLLYAMKRLNKRYGLASLCIGGGMGIAVIIKNSDVTKN